jgi:acyl-CoA synthetase (NDP forming)
MASSTSKSGRLNPYERIDRILSKALADKRSFLYEFEVYQLLLCMGLNAPSLVYIPTLEQFDPDSLNLILTPEVVVKVVSPDIAHKTDFGGVVFTANTVEDVVRAYRQVKSQVGAKAPESAFHGVMVVEKIEFKQSFGHELLASLRQDPFFGPVVSFGAGGVFTEFFAREFGDRKGLSIRSTFGLDQEAISGMIRQPAICQPLSGRIRGVPRALIEEEQLIELLAALRNLADRYSPHNPDSRFTIHELELNPVVVTSDRRLVAVDGLVQFGDRKINETPRPLAKVKKLLEPKSALVAGASSTAKNPGRIILENLISGAGVPKNHIYALHPTAAEIAGVPAIRNLSDLPEKVDLAVVSVPAAAALELLEELTVKRLAESVILISGGFGETEEGRAKEVRLRKILEAAHQTPDGGMVVNGGNCLGIYSRLGGYNTFFLPPYKVDFKEARGENVALISQSGAYLVSQASNFERTIRPRYAISFGNQIDLTVTDYLEYLRDDPEVDVYAVYLEGFRPYRGRRFLEVAEEIVQSGRAVIMFKAGRTAEGSAAASSHTAAISGDYGVATEVLRQVGVVHCDTLNQFEDYLKTFSFLKDKPPLGPRVSIVTNAGFECTVAADRLCDLKLAEYTDRTRATLEGIMPHGIVAVRNPLDCTPGTPTDKFLALVEAVVADENTDCVIASPLPLSPFLNTLPAGEGHNEDITREDSVPSGLIRIAGKTKKPLIVCVDSGRLYDPMARQMEMAGLPVFRRIDRATRALSVYVNYRKPAR